MADWRQEQLPKATELLDAKDFGNWAAFLLGLLVYATPDEIETWAYEVLTSTSHDTQVYWMGRCECTDHLLN